MERRISVIASVVFLGYWAQLCLFLMYNWHRIPSEYRIEAGGLAAASLGVMVQLWRETMKSNWANWMLLVSVCIALVAAMHLAHLVAVR